MNKIFFNIQIKWSENLFLDAMSIDSKGENARIFKTFSEFNKVLDTASIDAPTTGCYDKVSFIVTANKDGVDLQYEGRFDLRHFSKLQGTSTGDISLKQHMIDHCKYVCGNIIFSDQHKEAMQWLSLLETED